MRVAPKYVTLLSLFVRAVQNHTANMASPSLSHWWGAFW